MSSSFIFLNSLSLLLAKPFIAIVSMSVHTVSFIHEMHVPGLFVKDKKQKLKSYCPLLMNCMAYYLFKNLLSLL